MDSHFEKTRGTGPEPEHLPELRKVLGEKAGEAVNKLVGQKVEDYFRQHIKRADLESIAGRIFAMVLEGADEREIVKTRKELLDELIR